MPPVFGPAVVGSLVILACRQHDDGPAVGERENARLLAIHAIFDDELPAGIAEFALAGDAIDGVERFAPAMTHDHSLAGRETIGLHHDRNGFVFRRIAIVDELRR